MIDAAPDFSRRTFAALALNRLLTELVESGHDPNILGQRAPDGSTPIREISKLADDLWVGDAALGQAQVEFIRSSLVGIRDPNDTILTLLAQALQATKDQVAEVVHQRLGHGSSVSRAEFEGANSAAILPRRELSAADIEGLANLHVALASLGLDSITKLADEFVTRYFALTGSKVLYDPGRNDAVLFRDHGEHILKHLRRDLRLSIFDDPGRQLSAGEEGRASLVVSHLLTALKEARRSDAVGILGGFNAQGASQVAYEAAAPFPEIMRDGLMSAAGLLKPVAHVDHGTILGSRPEDVRGLLRDLARGSCVVSVEPTSPEAVEELFLHARRGGAGIVFLGLTRAPDPDVLAQLKACAQGEGRPGLLIVDLSAPGTSMEACAQSAAQYVLGRAKERGTHTRGVAEYLSMSEAPTEMNDIRAWAKQESTKYRLLRLMNALSGHLVTAFPDSKPAERREWSYDFAERLIAHTHGIDNFKDNERWQGAAKAALAEACPQIQALDKALGPDIMFASWFGIRDFDEKPLYFDKETHPIELHPRVAKLDVLAPHTLDAPEYAEVRLDRITSRFLAAKDSKPEVFLGSRDEMQLYYGSKGYQFDATTHDSNGTEYHLFRHPDRQRPAVMVIQGVDCEARLEHVTALMKANGLDPGRLIVRGQIARIRDINRSQLTQKIAEIQGPEGRPIAGVIIGNKNDPVTELRSQLGPGVELDVEGHQAGPFRFNVVKVKRSDGGPEELLLAFAPAYGQLSGDLLEACADLGARDFMLGGAGGSFNRHLKERRPKTPLDQVNDLHVIHEAIYEGRHIGLGPTASKDAETSPYFKLLEVPKDLGAKPATNMFSASPVEQTIAFRDEVVDQLLKLKSPGGDTDQETGPVFDAALRVSRRMNGCDPRTGQRDPALSKPGQPVEIRLQSTLIQTQTRFDGHGELAAGTAGAGAALPAQASARAFFASIGIRDVATKGRFVPLANAGPQLAPAPPPRADGDGAEVLDQLQKRGRLPNYASIITSSWMDSELQLKGEKRPLIFHAEVSFGEEQAKAMRRVLGELKPSQAWVIVDAASAGRDRMNDLAKSLGFETIIAGTKDELKELRGSCAFTMAYPDAAKKADFLARVMRVDNQANDPVFALSHHFILDRDAPAGVGPGYHALGAGGAAVDQVAAEVHSEVNRAYEGGRTEYGDGTSFLYPGMKQAITERWRNLSERGERRPVGFDGQEMKEPQFLLPDELSTLFKTPDGRPRRVYTIDGASLSSWPNMDAASQKRLESIAFLAARLFSKVKDQVAVVTGVTAHGVEGRFQRELHQSGVPVVGLATENLKVFNPDVGPEEEARVRAEYKLKPEDPLYEVSDHIGYIGLGFGLSWAGTPRLRLDHLFLNPEFEACSWAFGGSGVLNDMIGLQLAFNVPSALFTDLAPSEEGLENARVAKAKKAAKKAGGNYDAALKKALEETKLTDGERTMVAGASVAAGQQYPTHSVGNFEALCASDPVLGPALKAWKRELGFAGPIDTDADLARFAALVGRRE